MTNDVVKLVLLTLSAGLAMPLGASLAAVERIRSRWLETEVRHAVIAFGGGALLAAVALVLVPEGVHGLSPLAVAVSFASGSLLFMFLDMWLAANNTQLSQLVAMLSDFVPEALALGAAFALSEEAGVLMAGIIALQNIPEGFNAYREIRVSTDYRGLHIIGAFILMAFLGPIAGLVGYFFLTELAGVVSCIMLFAAGGILYIIFQDIAPQARLQNHWVPPLGASVGFLLGVLGKILTGA